jgi:DNA-binding HxlR family transcriptional regulator
MTFEDVFVSFCSAGCFVVRLTIVHCARLEIKSKRFRWLQRRLSAHHLFIDQRMLVRNILTLRTAALLYAVC